MAAASLPIETIVESERRRDVSIDQLVSSAMGNRECGHGRRKMQRRVTPTSTSYKSISTTTAAALALLACLASSAITPVHADNITSLTGTWSSGSGAVLTGPVSYLNPAVGQY